MTADQETKLCTDIGRIATALEALQASIGTIAAALQSAAEQQPSLRPPRPARQAHAPQRRVTA